MYSDDSFINVEDGFINCCHWVWSEAKCVCGKVSTGSERDIDYSIVRRIFFSSTVDDDDDDNFQDIHNVNLSKNQWTPRSRVVPIDFYSIKLQNIYKVTLCIFHRDFFTCNIHIKRMYSNSYENLSEGCCTRNANYLKFRFKQIQQLTTLLQKTQIRRRNKRVNRIWVFRTEWTLIAQLLFKSLETLNQIIHDGTIFFEPFRSFWLIIPKKMFPVNVISCTWCDCTREAKKIDLFIREFEWINGRSNKFKAPHDIRYNSASTA